MDWNGSPSTPSKLAYGQNERVFWGRDAETVVPGYTWSKVLLDPEQHHDGHQTGVLSSLVRNGVLRLGPPRKQERVIVDFLRALRIQISTALENTYQTLPPVEWWFSIPAVWDQQPRQRMMTVITEAGYLSDSLDSVFLITEAEAAAISTFHRAPNLQVGLLDLSQVLLYFSADIRLWKNSPTRNSGSSSATVAGGHR